MILKSILWMGTEGKSVFTIRAWFCESCSSQPCLILFRSLRVSEILSPESWVLLHGANYCFSYFMKLFLEN